KQKGDSAPFHFLFLLVAANVEWEKSPRFKDGRVFDNKVDEYLSSGNSGKALLLEELKIQYPYAYHFDANLIAKFMSEYSQQRGVRQVSDEVLEVKLAGNGFIDGIRTQDRKST